MAVDGDPDLSSSEEKLIASDGAANDYFGQSVSGAGDLDGDGYDDLLFGNEGYDTTYANIGAAFLFLGPVTGSLDLSGPGAADGDQRRHAPAQRLHPVLFPHLCHG